MARHPVPYLVVVWLVSLGPWSTATAQAPEMVQPGVISTDRNETFPAIDPVDGALWFSVYDRSFSRQTIMVSRADGDVWGRPVVARFSGQHGDRAPRFSADGSRLFFTSNRPIPPATEAGDFNIWVVRRSGSGWSAPEPLPAPVNSEAHDIHSASVADGTIYVASNREGGRGRSDIYRIASRAGAWADAEHLRDPINDERSQPDLYVSSDETWMILVITDHPDGLGGDDLYVSYRRDGRWTAPRNLGAPINSSEYEYGPTVSPDGRYLYFTSHRQGSADVYRVPLTVLGIER